MRGDRPPVHRRLLALGLAACALALLAAFVAPAPALRAWLAALLAWSAVPIGAVGLLLMMRLIPGAWHAELGLHAEAAGLLLPLVALCLLPVLLGMGSIYPWVRDPPANAFQSTYLAPWFFALRSLAWLALLHLLAFAGIGRRPSEGRAAAGLVAFTLLGSLVAIDWAMSPDPHFHASGFALYWLGCQFTIATAALVLAAATLPRRPRRAGLHGGLLLTMLLLWAYLAFLQYLILWSGNLPVGIVWYMPRAIHGWGWVLALYAALGGAPMLLLLLTPMRRDPRVLAWCAAAVLAGKALEAAWLVLPGTAAPGWQQAALFALALLGQTAVAAALAPAALARQLRSRAALS
jgi:hypothetical protein